MTLYVRLAKSRDLREKNSFTSLRTLNRASTFVRCQQKEWSRGRYESPRYDQSNLRLSGRWFRRRTVSRGAVGGASRRMCTSCTHRRRRGHCTGRHRHRHRHRQSARTLARLPTTLTRAVSRQGRSSHCDSTVKCLKRTVPYKYR